MILRGWKEIAAHLHCGVRTAQRWELEARLPVRRPFAGVRGRVIADPEQLDTWLLRGDRSLTGGRNVLASLERLRKLQSETRRLRKIHARNVQVLRKEMAALKARAQKGFTGAANGNNGENARSQNA